MELTPTTKVAKALALAQRAAQAAQLHEVPVVVRVSNQNGAIVLPTEGRSSMQPLPLVRNCWVLPPALPGFTGF